MAELVDPAAPVDHGFRFEAAIVGAEWNWARAAACAWWQPWRRWCLIRRARVLEREAELRFELAIKHSAGRVRA